MWNRRQFIKALGVLGGAVAAPLHRLGRAQAVAPQAELPPGAELYGGFLLLPEGAPVPAGITPPRYGVPNLCGVGEGGPGLTAVIIQKPDLDTFITDSPFRVLGLNPLPEPLRGSGGYILRHRDGPVYCSVYTYTFAKMETKEAVEAIRIVSVADFYVPCPIWVPTTESDREDRSWIKTTVSNEPAILISTAVEFVLYLILRDQLNTVVINKSIPDLNLQSYLAQIKEIN